MPVSPCANGTEHCHVTQHAETIGPPKGVSGGLRDVIAEEEMKCEEVNARWDRWRGLCTVCARYSPYSNIFQNEAATALSANKNCYLNWMVFPVQITSC